MSYRSTRLTPYHLLTPSAVGSPEEEHRCDRFVLCEGQEVASLVMLLVVPPLLPFQVLALTTYMIASSFRETK